MTIPHLKTSRGRGTGSLQPEMFSNSKIGRRREAEVPDAPTGESVQLREAMAAIRGRKTFRRHQPDALIWTMGLAGLFTLPATLAQAQTDTNAPAAVQAETVTNEVPAAVQPDSGPIEKNQGHWGGTRSWNMFNMHDDAQYMLGDWGGLRTRLADEGVTFDINDIGDFQADVSGSQEHRAIYFGRFRASNDIDFNKLSGFDGEFFISAICQYGQNLSTDYLHVNTLTSSIAGVQSERLDQMWYQQGLFRDLLKVKIGQIAEVNEFGATDFFDLLFNDETGYAPNLLFAAKQPFSPSGKPGVVVLGDLSVVTPGLYVKAGMFTAINNPYNPDAWGIRYGDDFQHGYVGSIETGYVEQHTDYAGVYKLGINLNDVSYVNPDTEAHMHGDYTAYALAEKTVYHPVEDGKLNLNKGLDLLLELLQAPEDRNPLSYEATFGGRYTGLIPGRDKDKTGFGIIYSENSAAFSQAYEKIHGHGLGGETTFELDYQFNPTGWFSLQLDTQCIIQPGGDEERSEITVLGLRTIVRF